MILLNKLIKTNGFTYIQEYRDNEFAVYSQWRDNEIMAYELIIIRKRKDRVIFDKLYAASEVYPDTKSWGKEAWTFKTYKGAMKRLANLIKSSQNSRSRAITDDIYSNNLVTKPSIDKILPFT